MSAFNQKFLLLPAVTAALCFAACSNNNPSGTAGEQPAPAVRAATSAGDASDEVNRFQPCEKLSVADVQPFFNTPVKKLEQPHINVPSATSADCNFVTVDGIQGLQITTVVGSMVKAFTDKPPTDDGKPGIPLTGIGDSAIRESKDIWVYALKNGVFCMIHGDHSGENAQGAVEEIRGLKLSDSLAQTIPPATAQAVAQNLGTLCNKIWGSGNMTPSFADLH